MMKIRDILCLALTALILNGCSENGFWFRSGSSYEQVSDKGLYYIGQPYRIRGVLYTPAEDFGYSEKGMAAIYSKDDQNRLTTNGEVFDDDKMTAAHKTLPLPCLVRITNLENGNTAIVRINDRGPKVNNRLIDVSRRTAEALEMPATGVTPVQVDILPDESRRLKEDLKPAPVQVLDSTQTESMTVYQPEDTAHTPIYNGQETPVVVADLDNTVAGSTESKSTDPKEIPAISWQIQAGVFRNPVNVMKTVQKLEALAPVSTKETSKGLTKIIVGPFSNRAEAKTVLERMRGLGYQDAWIQEIK